MSISAEGHAGEASTRLDKGIPIGRAPTVDLRNAHLSYVITWYVTGSSQDGLH